MTPRGLLFDQGISPTAAVNLRILGYRVDHVQDLGMAAATDAEIIDHARREDLVVVTTDIDFANIVALSRKETPSVITLRLNNPTAEEQEEALRGLLSKVGLRDLASSLVSLERGRYRKRKLPFQ